MTPILLLEYMAACAAGVILLAVAVAIGLSIVLGLVGVVSGTRRTG